MQWNVPKELTPLMPQEQRLVARMRRKSRFYVFLREIRGELFDESFEKKHGLTARLGRSVQAQGVRSWVLWLRWVRLFSVAGHLMECRI